MRTLHRSLAVALSLLVSCAGARARTAAPAALAARCEVNHRLSGGDSIEAHVERIEEGWLVSLRMSVHLGESGDAPIEVRGLGRVRGGATPTCLVVDPGAGPGMPRFDEALCLDELESLGELLLAAEEAARPGETVVQEVSLRARRRRRSRSRVAARVRQLQERAEISRDGAGRIVRVARVSDQGDREEVTVSYPAGVAGHCIRLE